MLFATGKTFVLFHILTPRLHHQWLLRPQSYDHFWLLELVWIYKASHIVLDWLALKWWCGHYHISFLYFQINFLVPILDWVCMKNFPSQRVFDYMITKPAGMYSRQWTTTAPLISDCFFVLSLLLNCSYFCVAEFELEKPSVFISYQWDVQDEVSAIRDRLERAGFSCWMDIGQMGGGDQLSSKIDQGLRGSKVGTIFHWAER